MGKAAVIAGVWGRDIGNTPGQQTLLVSHLTEQLDLAWQLPKNLRQPIQNITENVKAVFVFLSGEKEKSFMVAGTCKK